MTQKHPAMGIDESISRAIEVAYADAEQFRADCCSLCRPLYDYRTFPRTRAYTQALVQGYVLRWRLTFEVAKAARAVHGPDSDAFQIGPSAPPLQFLTGRRSKESVIEALAEGPVHFLHSMLYDSLDFPFGLSEVRADQIIDEAQIAEGIENRASPNGKIPRGMDLKEREPTLRGWVPGTAARIMLDQFDRDWGRITADDADRTDRLERAQKELSDWFPFDKLAVQLAREMTGALALVTPRRERPSPSPGAEAIDEHDAAILAFLNRTPSLRRRVSDVLPEAGPQDRKAIAKRLRRLADRTPPLVDYPQGGRSGVVILPPGVEALTRANGPTPH